MLLALLPELKSHEEVAILDGFDRIKDRRLDAGVVSDLTVGP